MSLHFILPSMEACVWGCKSPVSHSCCIWHRAWSQGANEVGHGAALLHPPHPGLHSSGSRELSQLSRRVTQTWITAALTVYYFESLPHRIHHGIGRDHDYSCSFCFFFFFLKINVVRHSAEWQLAWSCSRERIRFIFLPNQRNPLL